jgi:hypothetical protein
MIAIGVYLMMNRQIGWGIVWYFFSESYFIIFKNEYILLAFWQMRKQNFVKAAHWLTYIKNYPSQLHSSQYGYFHYLQGLTLAQDNPAKVEPLMRKALDYGLNMKQDRAMATLNLAAAALQKGRKPEAQRLLEEAKKLDSAGMMTDQIKMMKEPIENAFYAKTHAQS